uniref:Uncharacterized protein n=1 Tax=Pipistrellus kuhlii TaxID=59472 RepID=A0A7J7V0S6_PIPKU|nr:hypothetical protein mPipKuh1_008656 [Pipistrellus kuhlii]
MGAICSRLSWERKSPRSRHPPDVGPHLPSQHEKLSCASSSEAQDFKAKQAAHWVGTDPLRPPPVFLCQADPSRLRSLPIKINKRCRQASKAGLCLQHSRQARALLTAPPKPSSLSSNCIRGNGSVGKARIGTLAILLCLIFASRKIPEPAEHLHSHFLQSAQQERGNYS